MNFNLDKKLESLEEIYVMFGYNSKKQKYEPITDYILNLYNYKIKVYESYIVNKISN